MKLWLAFVLVVLATAPGVAAAQVIGDPGTAQELRAVAMSAHPTECARLESRINHFKNMLRRAEILENDMWSQRMNTQVSYLESIQAVRCPNDVDVDETGEALMALLKLGARAALTYFTFGAAGF